MNRTALTVIVVQALLTECVIGISFWFKMPWLDIVGLGLTGLSAMAAEVTSVPRRELIGRWTLAVACICTFAVLGSLLLGKHTSSTLDHNYAVLPWLVAAALLPTSIRVAHIPFKARWRMLVMTWAFGGGLIWLAASYSQNQPGKFYIGLLMGLALLVLCKYSFRLPPFGILTINTLILLLIGLPLVDLFTRPSYRLDAYPGTREKYYSYDQARKDPVAFAHWWQYLLDQLDHLKKDIYLSDPTHVFPWRLRPNSHGFLFQSYILINSRGFRGKEIPEEKGNAYRIVALGESTTFGVTLNAGDRPWPELLEQMIAERLKPRRRVEVINAGVPGYHLGHNLRRLTADIMPLKPDMIISYHGYNGFPFLDKGLPPASGEAPAYEPRPLKLLADCEYRLKIIFYRRHQASKLALEPPMFSNPMESVYAEAYRQLIQTAQTNRIRLVLANYSMAVDSSSDSDVVEFYRQVFPAVYRQIKANVAHSTILAQLAQEHPEIRLVDTHPHLDGEHEKFIDLVCCNSRSFTTADFF